MIIQRTEPAAIAGMAQQVRPEDLRYQVTGADVRQGEVTLKFGQVAALRLVLKANRAP